jgi:hypothetical protein
MDLEVSFCSLGHRPECRFPHPAEPFGPVCAKSGVMVSVGDSSEECPRHRHSSLLDWAEPPSRRR